MDTQIEIDSPLDGELVVITLTTLSRLFELDANAALLYLFYCKTAKMQANQIGYTNKIWATRKYCLSGLGWGTKKYYTALKILQDHQFVQIENRDRGDHGHLSRQYIKINYLLKTPNSTSVSYDTLDKVYQKPPVANDTPNAVNKKRNAVNEKNIGTSSYSTSLPMTETFPTDHRFPLPPQPRFSPPPPKEADSVEKKLRELNLTPLDENLTYSIADSLNVPISEVKRVEENVIEAILEGNKYKTKNINLTVRKWLRMGIERGNIQKMGEEERMIFELQNPGKRKKRAEIYKKLEELI